MPKIWQNVKKILVQFALNSFLHLNASISNTWISDARSSAILYTYIICLKWYFLKAQTLQLHIFRPKLKPCVTYSQQTIILLDDLEDCMLGCHSVFFSAVSKVSFYCQHSFFVRCWSSLTLSSIFSIPPHYGQNPIKELF